MLGIWQSAYCRNGHQRTLENTSILYRNGRVFRIRCLQCNRKAYSNWSPQRKRYKPVVNQPIPFAIWSAMRVARWKDAIDYAGTI